MENKLVIISCPLADPDLQIRGRGRGRVGDGHLDPEIRGGPGLKKNFSRPFGPQFGLKIGEGGGRPPWASPLHPPLMPLCFSPIPYVSFGTQIAKETKTQVTVIATMYFLTRHQRSIRYRASQVTPFLPSEDIRLRELMLINLPEKVFS